MTPSYPFICKDQQLWLLPEKAVFWEEEKALVLSDLHLGKSGHFRKSGIATPPGIYKKDMQQLVSLIQQYRPSQLIIVGDLFHSEENKELGLFLKWRNDFPGLKIQLIQGNHDILGVDWYKQAGVTVFADEPLLLGPFAFMHDYSHLEQYPAMADAYCITGHIHPGIMIKGSGKQGLRFPCFYFGEKHAILPAFGQFTGLAIIKPGKNDKVFPIISADSAKQQIGQVIAL